MFNPNDTYFVFTTSHTYPKKPKDRIGREIWYHDSISLAAAKTRSATPKIIHQLHYDRDGYLIVPYVLSKGTEAIVEQNDEIYHSFNTCGGASQILPKWLHALHYAQAVKEAGIYMGQNHRYGETDVNCITGVRETARVMGLTITSKFSLATAGRKARYDVEFPKYQTAEQPFDFKSTRQQIVSASGLLAKPDHLPMP